MGYLKCNNVEDWMENLPGNWKLKKAKYCMGFNMGQSPDSSFVNMEGLRDPFLQGNAEFTAITPDAKSFCTKPKNTNGVVFSDILPGLFPKMVFKWILRISALKLSLNKIPLFG